MDDGARAPGAGPGCPKDMTHGPCGGVAADGRCEVGPQPCPFVDRPTVGWTAVPVGPAAASAGSTAFRALLAARPVVVADLPARALDAASLQACTTVLVGHVDAVLTGDSGRARVQLPPAYRAQLVQAAGMAVVAGLSCRDRNRVALEAELAALAHVGVAGVHCVTGDHTDTGSRPDARPVFDLDSTELAALARRAGHLVSVAESPTAPPQARRAQRWREKVRAGAELCYVNHAGGVEPVRAFVAEAVALGVVAGHVPCVPVVLDAPSAALLASFPGLVLPEGFLAGVLDAVDPRAAGIAAAVELAQRLLELDGVVGVNLSGGAAPGGELAFATALAEIGARIDR